MSIHALRGAILCLVLAAGTLANAGEISFGVISHTFGAAQDETVLRNAIAESDADNLGFVVANGIKSSAEPCSDQLYSDRKIMFDSAKNGLVVSLAASDWVGCRNKSGKSLALERLLRLREMFFGEDFSLGASRIPLIRQSASPKFRNYTENARWELGDILFATINLPANNNHYLSEAGRNSEFDDRQIANRHWLQRIFMYAAYKKLSGIVLFSDGNPLQPPITLRGKYDGFADARQKITTLSKKFSGKVLVIHGPITDHSTPMSQIEWHGNLGTLAASPGWLKVTARDSDRMLFAVTKRSSALRGNSQNSNGLAQQSMLRSRVEINPVDR